VHTALQNIPALLVHRLVVPLLAPIHVRLQVAHMVDYMDDEEHKNAANM